MKEMRPHNTACAALRRHRACGSIHVCGIHTPRMRHRTQNFKASFFRFFVQKNMDASSVVTTKAFPLHAAIPSQAVKSSSRHRSEDDVGKVEPRVAHINGSLVRISSSTTPLTTVAHVLRQQLGLTGTKVACGQGNCGSCTILVNWAPPSQSHRDVENNVWLPVNACLLSVGSVWGEPVQDMSEWRGPRMRTIEGVSSSEDVKNYDFGEILADFNGTQCGFCSPGIVVKTESLRLRAGKEGKQCETSDIEDLLDGNLCRCTGYRPIIDAVRHAFVPPESDGKVGLATPSCVTRANISQHPAIFYGNGGLRHDHVAIKDMEMYVTLYLTRLTLKN